MPTPLLKNISEQKRLPIAKVEEYWKKAKEIAKQKFSDDESPDYYRYVTGIIKKMTGYVATSSSIPRRVQHDIVGQLHNVLKPLFKKIVAGETLPRGMACHALSFLYLMENDDPKLRQVMLYRHNSVDENASVLMHSVICKGTKIVYDSRRSNYTSLIDGVYLDSKSDSVLYTGVSLTLDQIQMLIGK